MKEYHGKTIAVIGMARTGMAVAEVMVEHGANVVLYDRKSEAELCEEIALAHRIGAKVCAGTDNVDLDGVDFVVPSPGVPANMPVFAEAKARGIEVISEIELAYRISKAPIIAITGTNGKTTTTVLTGKMLMAGGWDTYIAGNVVAGDIRMPLIEAAHMANERAVIVAEISTFQLEWIVDFRPKIAALLNVTSDHMDRHASVEEYAALKARIFENQIESDFSIINGDNHFTASLGAKLNACVLKFSTKSPVYEGGFVRNDDLIVRLDGVEHVICNKSDIPLRGDHNVENVLAGACAAIAMGVEPKDILTAVKSFTPVEHRLEPVATVNGVEYINNSMCTNVDAAVRSVEAISEPQIVIAGGKDKGSDYTALGEAFARRAKHVVLIGADARLIESATINAGFTAISHAESMRDAVERARDLAEPGDVVVLTPACASFDMFSSFEDRGQQFKNVVKEFAAEI